MNAPRPYRPGTRYALADALELLRHAREAAKKADSPRAAAAIRRALKSTEGALRHASTRRRHTEEQARHHENSQITAKRYTPDAHANHTP